MKQYINNKEANMKILITAGSTKTMIDEVRAIDNIFKGNTGVEVALNLGLSNFLNEGKGHPEWGNLEITFLTSYKEVYLVAAKEFAGVVTVKTYRTFDELLSLMKSEISTASYDLVIHSSAVSDYDTTAVYTVVSGTPLTGLFLKEVDRQGKIPSGQKLFVELDPTEKIVDKIKGEWGFTGKLVMFKLESRIADEELITRAKLSLVRPKADLIIANCLQWYRERAYVISSSGSVKNIARCDLTQEIMKAVHAK